MKTSQPEKTSKFHGGGEYIKTLFRELAIRNNDGYELHICYDTGNFMDDWVKDVVNGNNVIIHDVKTKKDISDLLISLSPDTYVEGILGGIDGVIVPKNVRVIGIFHGLRFIEKPIDVTALYYTDSYKENLKNILKIIAGKFYYNRMYKKHLDRINKCTEIVGVSEHSGYAARAFFPNFDKNRIHVFYPPLKYIEQISNKNSDSKNKFILMLGGDRWIKNLYRGVLALDSLFNDGQLNDYKVTIIGGIPKRIYLRIKNKDKFIATGYLAPHKLEDLYASCDLLFYPTLNEGFGSPPLEVMRYNNTCVVSAVSSLTGVYGDSVYYVNPYDINEMKTRILEATDKKISVDKIKNKFEEITKRQKDDLTKICNLITYSD